MALLLFGLLLLTAHANAKIFERCELARTLRDLNVPLQQIPTWLCIAHYESSFNTSAWNRGSGDHGLFQISDQYWCSPPGNGYACGQACSDFEDDDISDDYACVKRIYREHTQLTGDGFNAWTVYKLYCRNTIHNQLFMHGCFTEENEVSYHTHYSGFSSSYYYTANAAAAPSVSFHYNYHVPPPTYTHTSYNFKKADSTFYNAYKSVAVTAAPAPRHFSTYFPFLHPFTQRGDLLAAGSEIDVVTLKPEQPTTPATLNATSVSLEMEESRRRPLGPLLSTIRPTLVQQAIANRPFRPFLALRNQTLQSLFSNLLGSNTGSGGSGSSNQTLGSISTSFIQQLFGKENTTTDTIDVNAERKGPFDRIFAKVNDSQFSFSLFSNGFTLKKT